MSSSWRDALFELLVQRPVDTIYSIAFSLSFTPTIGLLSDKIGSDESRGAYLTASRELYDLLDDYVRDTDHLNINEIIRTRDVSMDAFVAVNEEYVRQSRLLENAVNSYDIFPSQQSAAAALTDDDDAAPRKRISETDRVEMVRVFNELYKHANSPFILNVNASRTIQHFDVDVIERADDETLMKSP